MSSRGILQCLLKAGADKNKADNLGRSPLWFAAATDHKSCVLALLKAGANKDQMNRATWLTWRTGHALEKHVPEKSKVGTH